MTEARGRFITFEGGEGTGKSTQVKRLADRLRLRGIEVVETREPGGSPGAEAMREILLSGAAKALGPETEAMLFAAARGDHVDQVIRPALERGCWVVCDRFHDSTRIYQGVLGKVDPKLINALERVTVGDLRPDLTIVLDAPPEIGLARIEGRGDRLDRFEAEDIEYHNWLRIAYRTLVEHEPDRCVLVDATPSQDAVAVRVWMVVAERLLRGQPAAATARGVAG
jgi:dTMP kinase